MISASMYALPGILDFIEILITYMNNYEFCHNGKQSVYGIPSNLALIPTNLQKLRDEKTCDIFNPVSLVSGGDFYNENQDINRQNPGDFRLCHNRTRESG